MNIIDNIGFWSCIILVPIFLVIGILFAVFKEKSVKYVSGFNSLSADEQDRYDKEHIVKDLRNSCFIWSAIMFLGGVCSILITPFASAVAYIIWIILFFKDVHFDTHKAFEKYLKDK